MNVLLKRTIRRDLKRSTIFMNEYFAVNIISTKLDELNESWFFPSLNTTKTELTRFEDQRKKEKDSSQSTSKIINKMPSKQASDVLAVEELVHEIKENLRLKARPSHNHGRNSRPSPYHIPCRSWNDQNCSNNGSSNEKIKKDEDIDDPYELLQTLLKSKNLVKEAVRRLQLNLSPKQKYFYESDDESRSPIFRVCQLEL